MFCLTFFSLNRIYYILTDDFWISNITFKEDYPDSFKQLLKVDSLSEAETKNLFSILDQTYTYLGKGGQCFVFQTADEQYVIKFCKFKKYRPKFWIIPFLRIEPIKTYNAKRSIRKIHLILSGLAGYQLAVQKLGNQTGIIYLHLSTTNHLQKKITVYDKLGFSREIDLDQTAFIVQKKGIPFQNYISNALAEKNIAKIKEAFEKVFSLYLTEYMHGIYDKDHGANCILTNIGFLQNNEIFRIDFGGYREKPEIKQKEFYKPDLQLVALKISRWAQKKHPKEYELLYPLLAEQYKKIIGEDLNIAEVEILRQTRKKNRKLF